LNENKNDNSLGGLLIINQKHLERRASKFQKNSQDSESSDYLSEMNKSVNKVS
jgi:hypothetical protein